MTFQELLQAARQAIADGDLVLAQKRTNEATALKAVMALEPAEPSPAQKVTNSPGFVVVEDEADKKLRENPFKSLGEFLFSVKDFGRGGIDPRMLPLRSGDPLDQGGFSLTKAMGDAFIGSITGAGFALKAAPTGMGESLPQTGGFLVASDRNTSILSRVYESGQLLSRIAMTGIGPNANGMTFYADAETSRVAGSRHGGIRGYWMSENSAVTPSSPTFRLMDIKLNKAAALVYATDELLADVSALESYVMRILPDELRFIVEDALINGNGVGQPLGILASNAVISVTKETGQVADTVVSENIVKMWSRLWARSRMNAIWIVNQDVEPQLHLLNMPAGTGGAMVYMPPGGLSAAPFGTLYGRPVIAHESAATVGDLGDIMLLDMTQYQGIEKGGIQSASSIHVRFTQDEQVFRFIYRVGGEPTWNAPLTPFKGTNTQSPFVALAARA